MSTLLAVLALALLFVAYGLLRPRQDCGAACGLCSGKCTFGESRDESTG
jgi:hypothetical protein